MILPASKAITGRTSFDLLAAAAAFTTLVFWASAFRGIRVGLGAYTPGHVALLRYLVASTVLLACSMPAPLRVPARRDLPRLAFLGLAGIAAYNVALNLGERTDPAGEASLLVNMVPISTALFATVFLGEGLKLLA
jgi:drug/metabolite transporter (DMT)-like permease